jgi:hypothetical protein
MRQLLGVVLSDKLYRDDDLKRHLMFFDKIHAVMKALPVPRGHEEEFANSMDFLHSHNILLETATCVRYRDLQPEKLLELPPPPESPEKLLLEDLVVRQVAMQAASPEYDVAPVFQTSIFPCVTGITAERMALSIGFSALPTPDETCAFQDILDFKAELHDKEWDFRRFLHSLATKKQTENEIRDEIEWMVSQYTKAMQIHHLKTTHGIVDGLCAGI